jgi:hypothetical protein
MSCYTSIPKLLGLFVLGAVMVAASWFCTTVPVLEAPLWGWIGVVFFGGCMVIMAARLFMRGPIVVLDQVGILDRRVSPDVILWSDILSVRIVTLRNQRWLGVEMKDPASFRSRLPKASRWLARANEHMGFNAFNVGFAGISPGVDEAWNYIREHHAEKVAAPRNV